MIHSEHPETLLQHFGEEEYIQGAVVPPIFQNSLFVFDECDQFIQSFSRSGCDPKIHNYSRISNPTLDLVERKIAELEHCEAGKLFSSGMAAISAAIMSCVESGSHVILVDSCYGPTKVFLCQYLARFGVKTTVVDGSQIENIADAIIPETKLIILESPTSFIYSLQDLEAVAKLAKEKSITTLIDNSYSSPILQNPADWGIDIIVHSASKYLGGHSDVVAGAICTQQKRMDQIIKDEVQLFGGTLAPFPAWLILRGMRTLSIRLKAHREAADQVAGWLEKHPRVDRVFHIGLQSHPQQDLIQKQMRDAGGLISFMPKNQEVEPLKGFVEALKVFRLGVSWGGFESLCCPYHLSTIGWGEKPQWVVRLFCGLEHAQDQIKDLQHAFEVSGL